APQFGPCVGEVLPQGEICNGLDDDCNGKIDDVQGANVACCPSGKCGVGICTNGMMQCSGGALSCVGGQGPQGEICNKLAEHCNGLVDEEPDVSMNDARISKSCGNEMSLPLPCIGGKTICKNGAPFCQGAVGPTTEACNCKDDDCNNKIDDNAFCPPDTFC